MPLRLDSSTPDFEARFSTLLASKREASDEVDAEAASIIADVAARGDAALRDYSRRWDGLDLTPDTLAIPDTERETAIAGIPAPERAALELAADRIQAYHEHQKPEDARWTDPTGAELGWRWTAVEAAGLYVPGGLASYPSSLLMNAIPAKVAGVDRLVVCAPTPNGECNPLVLLAARISGVDEIYRVGGAQAIAAMAYGTQTIAPVDMITGPGNAWVAAAKRQVFGRVGIDMIAGPSEVLIIADADNDPDWVALDLLAQAEHDTSAQSILITDDSGFAQRVADCVEARLETLDRRDIAGESWARNGAIILVPDLEQSPGLADRIAPEHLQICAADAERLSDRIRHAGAIFIGAYTPEAIGDYVAGPNHVLPTARSARFASGLSVFNFMKRTSLTRMTPSALGTLGPAAALLAESEGLEAHGLSVSERLRTLNARDGDG